jgi:hypothetical protein
MSRALKLDMQRAPVQDKQDRAELEWSDGSGGRGAVDVVAVGAGRAGLATAVFQTESWESALCIVPEEFAERRLESPWTGRHLVRSLGLPPRDS